MSRALGPLQFAGGHALIDGQLTDAPVAIHDGLIVDGDMTPSIDTTGYFVLPGIIDMHGDAFERHLAPRPSAPFPYLTGLIGTERDCAANGVTTAWLAQSWSWEGGARGPDACEALLAALAGYADRQIVDMRVQIRYETHELETADRLLQAVQTWGVDYVVFNNHLDEALDMLAVAPEDLTTWARKRGVSLDEFVTIIKRAKLRSAQVPRSLARLAAGFDTMGVTYGSHDDPDAETRETYHQIGANICEFPTSAGAATVAKANKNPIVMGAPNVVRGGSQAGNIAASTLVKMDRCDALVSDYFYPAMAQAAFALADDDILSFADAWAMVSTTPARVMKLRDRGTLHAGKRADIVLINQNTREVEATICGGKLAHLTGEMAGRFMTHARASAQMAAE